LLSIAVSNIFPTFAGMDSVGGLLISWLVIRAGYGNTKTSLIELADAGVDPEVKDKAQRAATKALEAIGQHDVEIRRVQGVKAGQSYLLELELAVPRSWTVSQTHEVEAAVRTRIGEKVRGVRRVRVRFVPIESVEDFEGEFISPSVSARSSVEPEEHHDAHEHTNGNETTHQHANGVGNGNGNGIKKRR
jgi:divalent metal cation (Fe/Co/Zn/Cd) transporter